MLSTLGAIAEESRAECNFSIFCEKIDKRIDLIPNPGCDPASPTCTTWKTKWHEKLLRKNANCDKLINDADFSRIFQKNLTSNFFGGIINYNMVEKRDN